MIYGVGTDIVELERVQRILKKFGMAFCCRVLHAKEIEIMPALHTHNSTQWLSSRFAAKEATVKALGTGFRKGITFQSIAILNNTLGKPELYFYDKAEAFIKSEGIIQSHLSISHERKNAVAFVVLEKA